MYYRNLEYLSMKLVVIDCFQSCFYKVNQQITKNLGSKKKIFDGKIKSRNPIIFSAFFFFSQQLEKDRNNNFQTSKSSACNIWNRHIFPENRCQILSYVFSKEEFIQNSVSIWYTYCRITFFWIFLQDT